jgi:hypothetical protein
MAEPRYELWRWKGPDGQDNYQFLPVGHPIAPELKESMVKVAVGFRRKAGRGAS